MTSLNGQDSQIPDNEPTLNGVDHSLHKAEGAFCVSVSACCGVCLIVCQMIGVLRMRSHPGCAECASAWSETRMTKTACSNAISKAHLCDSTMTPMPAALHETVYIYTLIHTLSITMLQQCHLEVPIPSVRRVCTLSSAGMSSNHLSQGGIPTPLLRTLPSSCICIMIVSSCDNQCFRYFRLICSSKAGRASYHQDPFK